MQNINWEKEQQDILKSSMKIIICCIMYVYAIKLHQPFRAVTVYIHGKNEYEYYN